MDFIHFMGFFSDEAVDEGTCDFFEQAVSFFFVGGEELCEVSLCEQDGRLHEKREAKGRTVDTEQTAADYRFSHPDEFVSSFPSPRIDQGSG